MSQGSFTTGYGNSARDRYAARNVDTCATFLLPHLRQLPSNFTFLDVGCGPGSITTDLARRFPDAKFTGIDPGKPFIDKAKELAKERVTSNVEFSVGDVMELDKFVKMGTFDVVFCHQMLVHVPDNLKALETMKAAAKADGVVAAREGSQRGNTFYPTSQPIEDFQDLLEKIAKDNGSHMTLGPSLVSLALKAGWLRNQITAGAGVWCYSEPADKAMWVESMVGSLEDQGSDWYQRALAAGGTSVQLRKMAEAWRIWGARDDAWSSFVSAEVICRKS